MRNDPVYRDSLGLDGATVLEHDLEVNSPAGDQPGYWSEFSVHSILWDLFDGTDDAGDVFQLPFTTIWSAFRSLALDSFVPARQRALDRRLQEFADAGSGRSLAGGSLPSSTIRSKSFVDCVSG